MADDDKTTIQLVEETSSVDKERLVTGRVRVSTSSNSVDELAHATLTGVRVEVTREAIGREIDAMPVARVEGEITIIPVVEEIVVVEKAAGPRRGNPNSKDRHLAGGVYPGDPAQTDSHN